MTNALKGLIITWTKSLLVLLVALGLPIQDSLQLALVAFIDVTVSLVATVWLLYTAQHSPARRDDFKGRL